MFFGSDRRNLHKTLLKTLRRNDDFTLTSHRDFTTIGATSCDVNVKSLWREFEDVMTSFFDLTLWLHKVKSLCHFNGENVTFVTILYRVGWKNFTRMRSGLIGSAFFFFTDTDLWHLQRFYVGSGDQILPESNSESSDLLSFLFLFICCRFMTFIMIVYRVGRSDFIQIGSNKFGYRLFLRGRRGDAGLRRFWRFYIGSDYQILVDSDPESSDWFFFLQIKFVLRL